MILGDVITLGGGGGETASIFVTGLTSSDTVTATKDGKTWNGVWRNPVLNPEWRGLPSGYKQVEYIESSGTQYINTGVTVNSANRVFKTKFAYVSGEYGTLFGTINTESEVHTRFTYTSSNEYEWDCYKGNGYGRITYSTTRDTSIKELELGNNYIKDLKTSTTLVTGTAGNYSSNVVMSLFGANTGSEVIIKSNYKMYYFQIIDNGTIVRDFVPCKNSSNEYGLYELASQTFYANGGSGAFTGGAEVSQYLVRPGYLISNLNSFGTYTVTATNGTQTATKSVLVDTATEYEIKMCYELLLTHSDFLDGVFLNTTPTYLSNQVDGTDGFQITGRPSGMSYSSSYGYYPVSNWLRWRYTINLTDYNTLKLCAKKVVNHGVVHVYVLPENYSFPTYQYQLYNDAIVKMTYWYPELDTEWHEYNLDISDISGNKDIVLIGGYTDSTGSASSSTAYCNIRFS